MLEKNKINKFKNFFKVIIKITLATIYNIFIINKK